MTEQNHPLVSIVLINHNGEKWIPETLSSLEAQTYRNLEYILVDDCSTDSSLSLFQDFAARNPNAHVFSMPQNGGPSAARNHGMNNATGEYIAFLDSDDLFLPNTISDDLNDFIRLSKSLPDLALLMTDAWVVSEKGRDAGRYMPRKYWGRDIVDKAPNWTLPSTWFVRKQLASSFFAPYRFGESIFVEYVRKNHGVAFVGRPGIKYRLRMHSATNEDAKVLLAARATQRTIEEGRLDNPVSLSEVPPLTQREIMAWKHGRTAKCAYVNGRHATAFWHGLLAAIADFPRFCKRAWRTLSFHR